MFHAVLIQIPIPLAPVRKLDIQIQLHVHVQLNVLYGFTPGLEIHSIADAISAK